MQTTIFLQPRNPQIEEPTGWVYISGTQKFARVFYGNSTANDMTAETAQSAVEGVTAKKALHPLYAGLKTVS